MRDSPFDLLSAVQLVELCGKEDDQALWNEFISRFQRQIFRCAYREYRSYNLGFIDLELIGDLVQEVYLRLLANNRRALREFKANSDKAVFAFLACVVRNVVHDHMRYETRKKRVGTTVSLDEQKGNDEGLTLADILPAKEELSPHWALSERLVPERLRSMLQSILTGENASRDTIIFQLHVINGLTAREIASLPTLGMSQANVEAVIRRTRERLRASLSDSQPPELLV